MKAKNVVWFFTGLGSVLMIAGYPWFYARLREQVLLTYQISLYGYHYLYLGAMTACYAVASCLALLTPQADGRILRYLDLVRILLPIFMFFGAFLDSGTYLNSPEVLLVYAVFGGMQYICRAALRLGEKRG
jgi:membrane associated rhomboid family serine protease